MMNNAASKWLRKPCMTVLPLLACWLIPLLSWCSPVQAEAEESDQWFSIESKRQLHRRIDSPRSAGEAGASELADSKIELSTANTSSHMSGQGRTDGEADEQRQPAPLPVNRLEAPIYQIHQGKMEGAFGIQFKTPLQPDWILQEVGWIVTPPLANEIHYYGPYEYEQFTYRLSPPDIPRLLKKLAIALHYSTYVDFDQIPIRIRAEAKLISCHKRIEELLQVLQRKYQTLAAENDLHRFSDGSNLLQVSCSGDSFYMDYFDLDAFETYLKYRNLPLMTKIKHHEIGKLTRFERYIADTARNLSPVAGRSIIAGFGISFAQPYEGHYVADQFTPFEPPNPLARFAAHSPIYEILISPKGLPIRINSKIQLPESAVKQLKWELDEVLHLLFGGFLKKTRRHTVVSSSERMIAMRLSGDNWLSISFIDGVENKAANKREKQRRIVSDAKAAAKIRREQMAEENGF